MKIAITSAGPELTSQIDPRFGRAQYFIIIDTKSDKFEAISNDSLEAMHGAGVQTSQFLIQKDMEAVITGRVGPNAYQALTAAGIKIYETPLTDVTTAVEAYNSGKLTEITQSGPANAGMKGRNK